MDARTSELIAFQDMNQAKAALLQWYRQDFAVGTFPSAVAFDGANIWVANVGSNSVTKY